MQGQANLIVFAIGGGGVSLFSLIPPNVKATTKRVKKQRQARCLFRFKISGTQPKIRIFRLISSVSVSPR